MSRGERTIAEIFPEKIEKFKGQECIDALLAFDKAEEELGRAAGGFAKIRERIRGLEEEDAAGAMKILSDVEELFRRLEEQSDSAASAAIDLQDNL